MSTTIHDDPHPRDVRAADTPSVASEERAWAVAAHLGIFAMCVVPLPFLVSLAILLGLRDRSAFVARHALEALHFQITITLLALASLPLVLVAGLGIGMLVVVAALAVLMPLRAALAAGEGREFRYPWSVRTFG